MSPAFPHRQPPSGGCSRPRRRRGWRPVDAPCAVPRQLRLQLLILGLKRNNGESAPCQLLPRRQINRKAAVPLIAEATRRPLSASTVLAVSTFPNVPIPELPAYQ